MLRSLNELRSYSIVTKDGDKRRINDFLVDDWTWTVRYLVVDTGRWLPGRLVLVSPHAFETPRWSEKLFPIVLSKKRLEDGPSITADEPVSRQKEAELAHFYSWPPYWAEGNPLPGSVTGRLTPDTQAFENEEQTAEIEERRRARTADPHLQSLRDITGFVVEAKDGDVGTLHDFIVDDDVWAVRSVVIDTGNVLPGTKIAISSEWITSLDWEASRARAMMTKAQVKSSPPFDDLRKLAENLTPSQIPAAHG